MHRIHISPAVRHGTAFCRAALLVSLALGSVQATTYSISNTTMEVKNDGVCGFMEALAASNLGIPMQECAAPSGITTINLGPGTYTAPEALEIFRHVNIRCPSGTCIIDAGNINDDLLTISVNSPNVTLYRLTLRQSAGNTNSISGLVVLGGTLNLEESVINGFRTVGLSIRGGNDHSIQRSTVSNNGYGLNLWPDVRLLSKFNTISNNWMGILATSIGMFYDSGSVVYNNVDAGIKILGGPITLESTIIRRNRNGGIHMDEFTNAHLFYCTIDSNKTSENGGGVRILCNPTTGENSAIADIQYSTISNNRAGKNGGGVYATGTVTLKNVTVSNDTADQLGGGVYHEPHIFGGGTGYFHLFHSTVAFNRAVGNGGGAYQVSGSSPFLSDGSIVSKNWAPTDSNVFGVISSVRTLYGFLGAGYAGSHDGDIFASNPLLGPLQDNAGPIRVKTHALLKGSPAIDIFDYDALITDARGFPRPGLWDLGAYETGPFETELLTVIGKSSDEHTLQSESGLSNGGGTVLWADALGDFVTYAVAIPEPGDYDISVRIKAGPNRPIVQLATSPGDGVYKPIDTLDLYRSSLYYLTRPKAACNFTSAGIKHFRFKVIGRNPSSRGFLCFYDRIVITKQ